MSNKTYNQYCAIAHALDTVGERWTLIVVRNLLVGPKRFSDLMRGLPGVSTNILTERLKLLEERGVITTRFLPPPAASTVYQLTERGYALADTLAALARWGSETLGSPDDHLAYVNEGIAFMVLGAFRRDRQPDSMIACSVAVSDPQFSQVFRIEISSAGIRLEESEPDSASAQITIGLDALSRLSSGRAGLRDLIDAGEAAIQGEATATRRVIDWVDDRN